MKKLIILLLSCLSFTASVAQLNSMGTSYFQNQYLENPAMAGISDGLVINLTHNRQLIPAPGAPVIQTLTADYNITEKVGVGLNIYNDKAGLLKRTRILGTYSYHLPIQDIKTVHFGISLGFFTENINSQDFVGDEGDINMVAYNSQKPYIDSDFGMAYTDNALTVQIALPNLKSYLKKENIDTRRADRSTFFMGLGYKLDFNSINFEPKVCFRGVSNFESIVDLCLKTGMMDDKVNVVAIYHTSNSATLGLGFNYSFFRISAMFSTSTSRITNFSNNMEVGIMTKLFNQDEWSR